MNDKDMVRTARLRRGKKTERFRRPPQSIGEALLFDDPELRDVNREDIMAFLELSEEGSPTLCTPGLECPSWLSAVITPPCHLSAETLP